MIHISISFHGIEVLSRTNGEFIRQTNRIHIYQVYIYIYIFAPAHLLQFASCDIDTARGQLNVFQHT